MLIAAISDFHLGVGDRAELFRHRDPEFVGFLAFLEDNFERIVLVGDIWETLTSRRYRGAKAMLRACRTAHPAIARRLQRCQYTYVFGNHDAVAGAADGALEDLVIQDNGTRFLFTHGHQSDPIVRRTPWLSELGVWAGGWIRRAGLGGWYEVISKLDRARGGMTDDPARCRFQRYAIAVARERGADVVVTGHTHIAARAEHGDQLFVNGGSCADGYSFVAADTRSGCVEVVHDW